MLDGIKGLELYNVGFIARVGLLPKTLKNLHADTIKCLCWPDSQRWTP